MSSDLSFSSRGPLQILHISDFLCTLPASDSFRRSLTTFEQVWGRCGWSDRNGSMSEEFRSSKGFYSNIRHSRSLIFHSMTTGHPSAPAEMSRKRKDEWGPRKLTAFFPSWREVADKMGPVDTTGHYSELQDEQPPTMGILEGPLSPSRASTGSSSCCSPAKSYMWLDHTVQDPEESQGLTLPIHNMPDLFPIASFPFPCITLCMLISLY